MRAREKHDRYYSSALYKDNNAEERTAQKRRTKIEASSVVVSLKELALLCLYASGKGSVYGLSLNLWREQNIRRRVMIFRPKISCFFFFFLNFCSRGCWFLFRVCLPHMLRELFKNTHRGQTVYYFSGRFFALAILLHSLKRRSLSRSRARNKATRAWMLLYTRAPSFSLRVVLYERGAAGLTRAFFFAKDGQTDGTDEAFADSIAVTETGGTEIDRTRSRWT